MKQLDAQFQDLLIVPRPRRQTFNTFVKDIISAPPAEFVIIDLTTTLTEPSESCISLAEAPKIIKKYYSHLTNVHINNLSYIAAINPWVRLLDGHFIPLSSPPDVQSFDSLTVQIHNLDNMILFVIETLFFIVKYEEEIDHQSSVHTYEFEPEEEIYLYINSTDKTITIWAKDLLG